MKEILIMTAEDALPGFALTGVRQQAIDKAQTWPALKEAFADPRLGVVAVDARLLETVDPLRLRELVRAWRGVLVTLPAPAGLAAAPQDEMQALVRRALGYHVRLEG